MRILLAILSLMFIIRAAPADDTINTGSRFFRALLAGAGMKPRERGDPDSIADFLAHPSEHILIVFGDVNWIKTNLVRNDLRRFVKNGGALLIATDRRTEEITGAELGIWVDGHVVFRGLDRPEFVYRETLKDCPLLQTPADISKYRVALGPLAASWDRVATNLPSFLEIKPIDFRPIPVAYLPKNCTIYPDNDNSLGAAPTRFAFASIEGSGRLLMIADHSIFIDGMMLQPDNDNHKFAWAVIDWLSENGKRNEVLFIDDGKHRARFDPNPTFTDPPLPHPDVLMPALDHVIIGLEQDNAFNRAITRAIETRLIFRGFLLGMSGLLVAWGLYKITVGKLRWASKYRLPNDLDEMADPASAGARRARDRARGNLAGPARELARRWFEELNISTNGSTRAPEVKGGGLFTHRSWSRQVQSLWAIAAGTDRSRSWSAAQLQRLAHEIGDMRSAVAAGEIQVQPAETQV
ncbi:MAG: DUF4350 domain-containing protein [Gemmataceae bacterium]